MSSKSRYKAGRFRAVRFAASKWTVASWQPDYLHGVLVVYPRLSGEITVSVEIPGEIKSDNMLRGKVETNP